MSNKDSIILGFILLFGYYFFLVKCEYPILFWMWKLDNNYNNCDLNEDVNKIFY